MSNKTLPFLTGLFALLSAPAFATVTITEFLPSHASPEPIGKTIAWTTTATDSNTGPLAFQFWVTAPGGSPLMVQDFNLGTLSGGIWTAPSFTWVPTSVNGTFSIEAVAKDFGSGETNTLTVSFVVSAVASGSTPVAEKTANPLVALFSASPCATGSQMRVAYQVQGKSGQPVLTTNFMPCHATGAMTFEVGGMYPSTAYTMYSETKTGSTITPGTKITFTTSALPTSTIPFPKFTVNSPDTPDTTYPVLLHNFITFGTGTIYPDVATDLKGNITWYYYPNDTTHSDVLTRPLPGGTFLTFQDDPAWAGNVTQEQFLREIDLAGNTIRETNMGAIQQQLVALGAVDGGPCNTITNPTVGSACIGAFHHDAIQTLPNGWLAVLVDCEKIFPAGTQPYTNDTPGLPVDIIGDMIIVLNANWQVVWYWDVFDPKGGGAGYPSFPISRGAPLQETCTPTTQGCPPVFLLGAGISKYAHDWLHANALYYWPAPQDGNTTGGDIILSMRHQDAIIKIDYQDTKGTGDIVWLMGPPDNFTTGISPFTFVNTWNDAWPWFSHQHEVGIENGGAGPMTLFDNGNTRVNGNPPLGLGHTGCQTASPPGVTYSDCDSRGMALTVVWDSTTKTGTATPVVSFDLGGFSEAMGSAQLLSDGNYFFENPVVFNTKLGTQGISLEIAPTNPAPQVGPADFLMNISGPQQYRGWAMTSIYSPPTT
ncbi:MAG TPA: aryl-sulfate sulfotransferase [Bryobacteraceae bacterium]|jgi:hypothetical protein|nr:aryl-sulfate sulfotransferase [Bryobacteraceae bacterium]